MTRRIRLSTKSAPRIRITTEPAKRIEPAEVAKALGAEPVSRALFAPASHPVGVSLRQELQRSLRSTGGRPSLEGAERVQKIPLSDEDWEQLVALAEELREEELRPSAGQVA